MKPALLFAFATLSGLGMPAGAATYLVQNPAVYQPGISIVTRVKNECRIENMVGNHVMEAVREQFPGSSGAMDASSSSDPFIKLTITDVGGIGGGSWTGPKWLSIRAEVIQGGQTLRSTELTRKSMGGPLGGVSGTCAIIERCAATLSKDVTRWLAEPTPAKASQ